VLFFELILAPTFGAMKFGEGAENRPLLAVFSGIQFSTLDGYSQK
jgi:hypothetical protein